jgi:hypothetical protein
MISLYSFVEVIPLERDRRFCALLGCSPCEEGTPVPVRLKGLVGLEDGFIKRGFVTQPARPTRRLK